MPSKDFDKKFQDLCQKILQVASEFVDYNDKEVDAIYFFGAREQKVSYTQTFYKINGKIVELHEVNHALKRKVDNSSLRISGLLDENLNLLEEISNLFIADNREVPTQIKISYFSKLKKSETKLDYGFHFSNHKTLRVDNVFDRWVEQIRSEN
ncbi:hypothetical protein ND861_09555 [Leptospira sp. 2 VSF19]|uniref:DUF600 family protein n=1 Tax=Leptospira soteropolitanensis TaxID=2950025 RepID=A0AAW5VNV1_9LEPT|nr:hypothetical protein [Leptospira soteropolitanensis]MCW7492549.1 hypothetical protein [Leptospira soteropolitanensis]MCW7500597.1 hypothetical protein [Leptospira soteropolitanensis]MCW7522733.1 hypothetical protein [Leptospira soteropolitanensis]MCW7526589.1 hypothetical protein [Leptospira soteropolitanensis]MCW7530567.1 hypothetical protein [Leptospira soteropolitanensis]